MTVVTRFPVLQNVFKNKVFHGSRAGEIRPFLFTFIRNSLGICNFIRPPVPVDLWAYLWAEHEYEWPWRMACSKPCDKAFESDWQCCLCSIFESLGWVCNKVHLQLRRKSYGFCNQLFYGAPVLILVLYPPAGASSSSFKYLLLCLSPPIRVSAYCTQLFTPRIGMVVDVRYSRGLFSEWNWGFWIPWALG